MASTSPKPAGSGQEGWPPFIILGAGPGYWNLPDERAELHQRSSKEAHHSQWLRERFQPYVRPCMGGITPPYAQQELERIERRIGRTERPSPRKDLRGRRLLVDNEREIQNIEDNPAVYIFRV